MVAKWRVRHHSQVILKEYSVLGQYCTEAMAKHLKKLKISYAMLKAAFEEHFGNRQDFNTSLHGIGIL